MKENKTKNDTKGKPGPKAETLTLSGDWKAAVRTALSKGKPPKAAKKKKRR